MTDADDRLASVRRALAATAEEHGPPDEEAAWARVRAGAVAADRRRGRRRRFGPALAGLAVAGAAAGLVVVMAVDGDDREAVEVGPFATTTTEDAAPPPTSTSTTIQTQLQGTAPPSIPASSFVVSTSQQLELWDGDTGERVAVLATAGVGRPSIAESYRFGAVSYRPELGRMYFTEHAGPEDHPSIWFFDLATGAMQLLVDGAWLPAVSPQGLLAYVEGFPGGTAQTIVVVFDHIGGSERRIEGYETGTEHPGPSRIVDLEWSPDGSQLLFEDHYEEQIVGILDPDTAETLTDAQGLAGEHRAAAWLDDGTILSETYCCYGDRAQEPSRYVVSDATTGAELRAAEGIDGDVLDLAVGPDGRVLFLRQDDSTQPVIGTLVVPTPGGEVAIPGVRSADW